MLEVAEVDFAYRADAPRVLAGVSLAAAAGEIVGVLGPSGSGKSTLLRLAAGLARPLAGRVAVDTAGLDPARAPRAQVARALAYLPQETTIDFPFTVAEVVLMGRYAHRRGPGLESGADRARADEAMHAADVAHLGDRRFRELSGGERRRALLAQALCQDAPLLLLDEPTAALDPAHAIALFDTLRALASRAVVIVTHDLHLAVRFCDRVLVLAGGRAAAEGPPRAVLASPAAARAFAVELRVGELPGPPALPYAVPGALAAPPAEPRR